MNEEALTPRGKIKIAYMEGILTKEEMEKKLKDEREERIVDEAFDAGRKFEREDIKRILSEKDE